jgi:uncharacterized membrane protein YqgA involved in biofilm formation
MIGTILNSSAIVIGGSVGLTTSKALSASAEAQLRIILAAFTVFFGLRLTWLSVNGSALQILKQCVILILALMLGKLTGRVFGLQKTSNVLGRRAQEQILATQRARAHTASDAFKPCAILFCAAPLGILGAVQDGLLLSRYFYPLAVKAVMDGFAAMGFVRILGWGVLLSAIPVLAMQGTLTLVCACFLAPFLSARGLLDSVNAVGGVLVFCVALVMLGLKRIELTDYLPSLLFAPLLTWLWP